MAINPSLLLISSLNLFVGCPDPFVRVPASCSSSNNSSLLPFPGHLPKMYLQQQPRPHLGSPKRAKLCPSPPAGACSHGSGHLVVLPSSNSAFLPTVVHNFLSFQLRELRILESLEGRGDATQPFANRTPHKAWPSSSEGYVPDPAKVSGQRSIYNMISAEINYFMGYCYWC